MRKDRERRVGLIPNIFPTDVENVSISSNSAHAEGDASLDITMIAVQLLYGQSLDTITQCRRVRSAQQVKSALSDIFGNYHIGGWSEGNPLRTE